MQSYLNIRGLIGLLRRQRRVVITIFCAVMALVTVATFSLQAIYTATSTVVVNPTGNSVLQAGRTGGDLSDSARIDTEALIVRSPEVMRLVAERLDLYSQAEFQPRPGMVERLLVTLHVRQPQELADDQVRAAVLGNLAAKTFVQRRGLTFALGISAQSSDPELAASIANALAQAYIDVQVQRKVDATTASRDVIEARIADAAAATQRAEEALDRYLSTQVDLLAKVSGHPDVAAIRQQIEQVTGQRSKFSSTLDTITKAIDDRDWGTLSASINTSAFLNLQTRQIEIEARIRDQGEDSPFGLSLREELAKVQASLLAEANMEADLLTGQITAAQAEVSALRDQMRNVIVSDELPSDVLMQTFTLQRTAEASRNQYQMLLARANELDTEAYLQVADSEVVAEAGTPADPSYPNTKLFMLMGMLLAIGASGAAAVLIENYVGGFTDAEQTQAVLGSTVISVVPKAKAKPAGQNQQSTAADMIIDAPLSAFAESIRKVRVSLERPRRLEERQEGAEVIAITSALPGEGKTTIALALARSYQMAGRSCLLVDCDLRRPGLHRLLNVEQNQGLINLLKGEIGPTDIRAIVVADPMSDATIIVGSRISSESTDHLFDEDGFVRLISASKKMFDVIILDSPPVIPVVDSIYISDIADKTVFVARWVNTPQVDARKAILRLKERAVDAKNLFVVLNCSSEENVTGKYYGYTVK